ncbi:MAG: TRAP transporter substrate-binding protein DctP [Thermovirgaceae bacterium]|nr:TRAP transporter substrate-binding protein DctP [Thermovirgaceae bacterium]
MRQILRKSILFLVAVFILGATFSAAFAAEVSLSNQLPPSHHMSKGMEIFAEKVSEYSGGKQTVKIFHSAQLFKDTEVVEAIQEGLVELGLVPVNKWSGMIPATDVFEMPFLFTDLSSPKKFLDAGAGDLLDKAFQEKNAKVVFWVDYGLVQFFNNARQLKRPEDFKGLKFRAFSKASADTISALGGTPVVMSSSEMYMALQRGTVDGAATGMPAAVSRKIFEVQKHMVLANYTTAQFMVQAGNEWWKTLTGEEREVFLKAGADAAAWIRGAIEESENAALETIREAGVDIYTLTPEDREAFVKATEPVRQEFATGTGELGKKLIDIAMGLE